MPNRCQLLPPQSGHSSAHWDACWAIANLGTAGAVRMFFPWFGNWHGEHHDEISTDRLGGGIANGRCYVCHGSKWPRHRRISTRAMESQSRLWLLQLLLCPASLCARTTLLCSGLSRTTLRLQTLAPLAVGTIGRFCRIRPLRASFFSRR